MCLSLFKLAICVLFSFVLGVLDKNKTFINNLNVYCFQ